MTSRSILVASTAFVIGVMFALLVLGRGGPAMELNAAAAEANAVSQKPSSELAELRAEVEVLKQKATDQAHVMVSVGYHFNNLWFAGQHGNWPLAQFYWNETGSHLRWGVRVIPIRKDNAGQEVDLRAILEAVENSPLKALEDAIKAQDREKFVAAYKFTLEGCYACHKASDKPYLRPQLPAHPAEPMMNFEPLPAAFAPQQEQFRVPEKASEGQKQQTRGKDKKTEETGAMLIEPSDLQARRESKNLRILDARSKGAFAKGHIPGAVWVDVPSWQALGRTDGGFQNAQAWAEKVGQLGIDRDCEVVVYGTALPDAARIWWTLRYLGLEKVALLNGGWDMWMKEGHPTDTEMRQVAAVPFEPKFQADRLAEIDTVKESLRSGKGLKVVDTRSTDEFTGKAVRGKRGGHISGATHLEWKELVAEDGRLKTQDQLRELFRKRGILPDETAVCY